MLLEGLGGGARRGDWPRRTHLTVNGNVVIVKGFLDVGCLIGHIGRVQGRCRPPTCAKSASSREMLLHWAVVDGVEQVLDVATSQSSSAAKEATSLRSQAVKVMWPKQC